MEVDVVDPRPDCVPAGLLTGRGANVEHLIDQQPVVPLDLPVVARGAGADALVPVDEGFYAAGEVLVPIVRAVVRDHPVEPVDAVGGEEGQGAAEESDRGGGPLVLEGLGIGQPREPVHG